MGSVSDIMADNLQRDIDNGKISEAQAKKRFENQKKFQVSAALVSGLAGAFGNFWLTKSDKTLQPAWLRWALAGVNLATDLVMTGTQVKQIASTQFGDGNGGSAATVVPQAVPILDENRDLMDMSTISTAVNTGQSANTDTKVYVTEKDITDTQNKVKVTEQNSTF